MSQVRTNDLRSLETYPTLRTLRTAGTAVVAWLLLILSAQHGFAANPGQDLPDLTINGLSVSYYENHSGTITGTVSRDSSANGCAITVNLSLIITNAGPAGRVSVSPSSLSLAVGENSKTFNLILTDNTLDEGNTSYSLTASEGQGLFDQDSHAFDLIDDDETPTFSSPPPASISIGEGSGYSHVFSVSDADGPPPSVIKSGSDEGHFSLIQDPQNASQWTLSLIPTPNYEAPVDAGANNSFNVTLTVSDGTNTTSTTLALNVLDVNEAPGTISFAGGILNVDENAGAGVSIGTFSATDPDNDDNTNLQSHSFAVVGLHSNLFEFSGTTLQTKIPVPGPSPSSYTISVQATDNGQPALSSSLQSFTVYINQLNSAPYWNQTSYSLAEHSAGTIQLLATDPDNDMITFAEVGGADAAHVSISSSGVLSFGSSPDYENPVDVSPFNSYQVAVTLYDGTVTTGATTITVNIIPVNENPTGINLSPGTVAENAANTFVGTLSTSVPDNQGSNPSSPAQTYTYSFVAGSNSYFSIGGSNNDEIYTQAGFDYESYPPAANVFSIKAEQVGSPVNSVTQVFTVSIGDLNEPPYFSGSPPTFLVPENSVGSINLEPYVGDQDAGDSVSSLSFMVDSGEDSSLFTFVNDRLQFNSPRDYEGQSSFDGDDIYELFVRVVDQGGASSTTMGISVSVTPVNEAPELDPLNPSPTTEPDQLVMVLPVSDPEGDALSFGFSSLHQNHFEVVLNGQGQYELRFKDPTNYESLEGGGANSNEYTATVVAHDSAGMPSTARSFTAVVEDLDEPPLFSTATTHNIPENSGYVATLSAADPENGTVNYHILTGSVLVTPWTGASSDGVFQIVNGNELHFISDPDFEAPAGIGSPPTNEYHVDVFARVDGSPEDALHSLVIHVQGVPDEAPSISLQPGVNWATNEGVSFVASGAITVSDLDSPGSGISVSGSSSNNLVVPDNAISVTGTGNVRSLQISGAATSPGSTTITLFAFDAENHQSAPVSFVFTVIANTVPPVLDPIGNVEVIENQTFVVDASASSSVGSVTFSVTGIDQQHFSMDANSGVLSFVVAPDFESPDDSGANNVYDVTVIATDSVGATDGETITVSVLGINESPVVDGPISFPVAENESSVGTVSASDPENDSISFAIAPGPDSPFFEIDAASGALTFRSPPDFEDPLDYDGDNEYVFSIYVNDAEFSLTETVYVNVSNVAEVLPPTISNLPDFTFYANETFLYVDLVEVSDPDTGVQFLTVSATSSDPNIVANQDIQVTGLGSRRDLLITPATNQSGTVTITLTVDDGTSQTSSQFDYTILPDTIESADTDNDGVRDDKEDINGDGIYNFPDPSDWNNPDTDGDQVPDGVELLTGLDPQSQDSDSDGVDDLIEVNNSPPDAVDDAFTLNEGVGSLVLDVVANDVMAPDIGEILTITSADAVGSLGGSLAIAADGATLIYTLPGSGVSGVEAYSYTVDDGNGASDAALIAITLVDDNLDPTLSGLRDITMPSNVSWTPFLFEVTDPDGVDGNVVLTSMTDNTLLFPNDSLVFGGSGSDREFALTPATGQWGQATLTITADDGVEQTSESITVSVGPHGLPPADSDGDGIPDYLEDENGNGTTEGGAGETAWLHVDTDGDLIYDALEIILGTDPNIADNPLAEISGLELFNELE